MNFSRLNCFFDRHWRDDGRDALGEHRFAGAGRADHQDVVTAGYCHFHGAFDVALTFYVVEIDIVVLMRGEKLREIAAGGEERKFAAQKREGLPQVLHAVDVEFLHHGGFARVRFRDKQSAFAAPGSFERYGQEALYGPHCSIEREFTDKTEIFEGRTVDLLRHGDHAERYRQIKARAFFLDVGGSKIDSGAAARPVITTVRDRGRDSVATLFDCRVR